MTVGITQQKKDRNNERRQNAQINNYRNKNKLIKNDTNTRRTKDRRNTT